MRFSDPGMRKDLPEIQRLIEWYHPTEVGLFMKDARVIVGVTSSVDHNYYAAWEMLATRWSDTYVGGTRSFTNELDQMTLRVSWSCLVFNWSLRGRVPILPLSPMLHLII